MNNNNSQCSTFITNTENQEQLFLELKNISRIINKEVEKVEINQQLDYENLYRLFIQGQCVCQKLKNK